MMEVISHDPAWVVSGLGHSHRLATTPLGSPLGKIPHRLKAARDLATRCDSDEFHRVFDWDPRLA